MACPVPLEAVCLEKVWGRPRGGLRLGEIWFEARPLLLKFIFTSEKLSVQVHPQDAYAQAHEKCAGKTECWYIIDAEPGAQLAIGLRRPLTPEQVRASVADQTIEGELNWLDMHPGDFIFVPAGTVHAIGPGLTLCEIQQFSDVTYRLYDYGRPRELHLERALDVIRHHPAAGRAAPLPLPATPGADHDLLAACRCFAVERLRLKSEFRARMRPERFEVLAVISGRGEIVCGGEARPYAAEQMWQAPRGQGEYQIRPASETVLLKAYVPESLAAVERELEQAGVAPQERRRVLIEDV